MTTAPHDQALRSAFRNAYVLGFVLCVVWPLLLQLMLGTVVRPGANPPVGAVQQLGYTFTGLSFAAAAFVTWRSGKVRQGLRNHPREAQPRVVFREVLLYAALFELSSFYGLIYWMLVGEAGTRHARAFLALSTVMFLAFVPRLPAWGEAADGLTD